MLGKRKEAKRKSMAMTLMRDVQGSAAAKLAMFEKVRAAGGVQGYVDVHNGVALWQVLHDAREKERKIKGMISAEL